MQPWGGARSDSQSCHIILNVQLMPPTLNNSHNKRPTRKLESRALCRKELAIAGMRLLSLERSAS